MNWLVLATIARATLYMALLLLGISALNALAPNSVILSVRTVLILYAALGAYSFVRELLS